MATTREQARALLDTIPEGRLDSAQATIAALADPVIRSFLEAPEDDEPTTTDAG